MNVIERIAMGGRGRGSLFRQSRSQHWYSAYSRQGKEHVESCGTPDLKKARAIHKARLDTLASERQGHVVALTPASKKVTVATLLDALESEGTLRALRSLASLRSHVKPARQHFGLWRAAALTADHVDAWIEAMLEQDIAPATVNRRTGYLAQAYRLGLQRRTVTAMPHIRHLAESNRREGFFEAHEFTALLAALPEHLQDVATFAYLTGWRKGEILTLTWPDVDLDGRAIRLKPAHSKTKKGRVIGMDDDLLALLKRREAARLVETPSGAIRVAAHVFHRQGRPLVDFRVAWRTACLAAGLCHVEKNDDGTETTVPDKLFHDFRRTAVRNMVRAGVPESVAMEISGHRTRSMFLRYDVVDEQE